MSKLYAELALAHATIARLYQEAAGGKPEVASEVVPAEKPAKGKPGPKAKAKEAAPGEDPLAGLTGNDEEHEAEQQEDDPLAGLMGGGDEPPEEPKVTRESLAKLLGEMAAQVDRVKGKGVGAQALAGMFKKHGAENLKTLPQEEFLAVQNEANAVINAIKGLADK